MHDHTSDSASHEEKHDHDHCEPQAHAPHSGDEARIDAQEACLACQGDGSDDTAEHSFGAHGCGCPFEVTSERHDHDDHSDDHSHHHHEYHHHDHDGHDHAHSGLFHTHANVNDRKRLIGALVLTFSMMFAEVIGGIVSGSLALLSDAGHMLTDAAALLLSFLALKFAARPADARRTFGYSRFEILSALVNAMTLIALSLIILWEAIGRILTPTPIRADVMLWVAVAGLVVNLGSAFLLSDSKSLNVRGAFLHVLGDTLSSVGVIIAAIVAWKTGWLLLDPILSMAIAGFISFGAIKLLKQATHILLEGTPENIHFGDVVSSLLSIEGVCGVHDLHLWTLAQGHHALSAHVEVLPDATLQDHAKILNAARTLLKEKFSLDHATLQLEGKAMAANASSEEKCADHDHDTSTVAPAAHAHSGASTSEN